MEVTLEQAYGEACRMLGEAMVKERLMNKMLAESTNHVQATSEDP